MKSLLIAIMALGLGSATLGASEANMVSPAIVDMRDPVYPVRLSSVGIYEGSVTLMIDVDSLGNMTDWIAISGTREEFVQAIAKVIDSWTFRPGTKDGKPIPYSMCVNVKFRSEGVMMAVNGVQMIQAYMNGIMEPEEVSYVSKFSDLDGIPNPVEVVEPMVSGDIPVDLREGEVVIGFFIDKEGSVRMPVLMECEGDIRLAYTAYDALMKWKFDAPKEHGKETMCRAVQRFIFKNK